MELIASELMTNAVRHAPSTDRAVRITLIDGRDDLLIEVVDGGIGVPSVRDADEEAESGRGLALVEALSAEWSWYRHPDGTKSTWARLSLGNQQ